MIYHAYCKINLGLQVLARRPDGYHDISTVMFPVPGLYDTVEVIKADGGNVRFSSSGLTVDCPVQDNLCMKAYALLQYRYGIGGAAIHLHKTVPFGAGLGGGSSDAVAVLKLLDRLYRLNLSSERLIEYAAELGSDTAFFVCGGPMLCEGKGDRMKPVAVSLKGYRLTVVKPPYGIKTAEAYRNVVPDAGRPSLEEQIVCGVEHWKDTLHNDFEPAVLKRYPVLNDLKRKMYEAGASFVSMSGSGSAFFALSREKLDLPTLPPDYFHFDCLLNE